MKKLVLEHSIDCGPEAFWRDFFDRDLTARLFRELGFHHYETVEQREDETHIHRTVHAESRPSVPAPLAKLMGASFRFTETGTFDKASGVFRFRMTPSTLADKIRVEGRVHIVPAEARVTRHLAVEIEAKVFAIGSMIEQAFEKQIAEGWTRGAELQNRWLRAAREG